MYRAIKRNGILRRSNIRKHLMDDQRKRLYQLANMCVIPFCQANQQNVEWKDLAEQLISIFK